MANLIQGKDLLLFFRREKDHVTEDGAKLRFQTEHSITMEKESEATVTKDGIINTISDGENVIEIVSLAYRDDKATLETWEELRNWFEDNEKVEVWEVDITSAVGGASDRYRTTYYQGYFSSFELSATAEEAVELSYTYVIDGNGVRGNDTLTEEQQSAISSMLYDYRTIQKTQGAEI